MPSAPLRIAIAQSLIEPDVRCNCAHAQSLMRQAADAGARLIVFPEGALSGYPKDQFRRWADVDWDELQTAIESVATLAGELNLFVVIGTNHKVDDVMRPRNSLVVISDKGDITARYEKRLCSHNEISNWYSAGTEPCVFEIDGYRFGCILCIEIHFPRLFAEYEEMDVDCVLFPAYSHDPIFWTEARGHAAMTNMWVAMSTPSQCGATLPSGLIGPNGQELCRTAASAEPTLVLGTIDPGAPEFDIALNKARPWRRKARSGEIYKA